MVKITLHKQAGKTTIKDAGYQLTWVYNPIADGKRQYYILPAARYQNDSLLPDRQSQSEMKLFLDDSRTLLNGGNIGIREIL